MTAPHWTPRRWQRASQLLDVLLDLPPAERAHRLALTDATLRADVARLLARDASQVDALSGAGRTLACLLASDPRVRSR